MLNLYVSDGCPYCNKVLSFLKSNNIEYNSILAPRGSKNREKLLALGGQHQVPFLQDTDRDVTMYESDDIIEYVGQHYM
jgi:glutaredoxin 3